MPFQRRVGVLVIAGLCAVLAVIAALRLVRVSVPKVAVAQVSVGPIESWITTNGTIEPAVPHVIRARVPTFVKSVRVTEGQTVKKGEVVLTLDVAQQRADLALAREELAKARNELRVVEDGGPAGARAEAQSELEKVEAEVAHLEREREAIVRLVAKQAATGAELGQTELALARARATRDALAKKRQDLDRDTTLNTGVAGLAVERARDAVKLREVEAQSAEIRAPGDGTVYALPARPGSRVDAGAVLAEIADLGAVKLRAFVDEPDLASVEEGQRVEVSWSALPNQAWTGQVERVPKEVVSRGDRRVGEVVCSIANSNQKLIPNLDVDVRIRVNARARTLLVPREAVRIDQSQRYVLVVKDGRLERRPIAVDIASVTSYSVVKGLREGELVALRSDVELRDGMRVDVVPQAR
jgi:multidrug efflux pump subunit AcrA (membrane-fusion protein)